MNQLILPLVEETLNLSSAKFDNVYVIGVQHILETTHSMFRSMFSRGLKPEHISLLGKCYSTNLNVYQEMLEDGIYVSPLSFRYDSYISFDEQFENSINQFIESELEKIKSVNPSLIIVLDDGGKFLSKIRKVLPKHFRIIGVEQTSAGYHQLIKNPIPFPVINVARSPVKLSIESPMIAEAAAIRINQALEELSLKPEATLILGAGPIGIAIYNQIKNNGLVKVYDTNNNLSQIKESDFLKTLPKYDCIIGCTGKTTISKNLHKLISAGTSLISVSSSDREFDSLYLRKLVARNNNCHANLFINELLLVNSGFPVNFDGKRENIHPDQIQLTIALIAAAMAQSTKMKSHKKVITPIDSNYEEYIKNSFTKKYKKETGAVFY